MKTSHHMFSPAALSAVEPAANDCRGNAAIEFAMIVPLMLVMFFGTVEFSSGVAVDRKVDAGDADAFRSRLAIDVGQ